MTLIQVIEALLFSAQKPLTTTELRDVLTSAGGNEELVPNEFAGVKEAKVAAALGQLKSDYTLTPRGFQLVEKAGGWQLVSHPDCARWVHQLFPGPKPARLSPRSEEHTSELQSQFHPFPTRRSSDLTRSWFQMNSLA